MHRGQSITDLETVAAAEKYVCVSRPGQRWAAKTLRSSVSQHSRHSANSAFIPYPGNWVLLPPYSEPPLQLTDKSTLCWSMMDGWTVEEGRGHTLSLHCSGERLRPFVTLLSFNNISDLIPSEGWQVPGTTLSVHSCVSSAWEDSPLDCQQYLLFAQGQWLQIYRAIIVGLCVCVRAVTYMKVLLSQLDKYHTMTDLYCRAAVGVWHSKDQFQAVNKDWSRNTSQPNVTRPPFPHLFTLTPSTPFLLCPQLSHGNSANCSFSLSICQPCYLVPQYAALGDRG